MSDQLTCPLCKQSVALTLINHLRDDHKVDPEAFRKQFPKQPLHAPAFAAFIATRNAQPRRHSALPA